MKQARLERLKKEAKEYTKKRSKLNWATVFYLAAFLGCISLTAGFFWTMPGWVFVLGQFVGWVSLILYVQTVRPKDIKNDETFGSTFFDVMSYCELEVGRRAHSREEWIEFVTTSNADTICDEIEELRKAMDQYEEKLENDYQEMVRRNRHRSSSPSRPTASRPVEPDHTTNALFASSALTTPSDSCGSSKSSDSGSSSSYDSGSSSSGSSFGGGGDSGGGGCGF